MRQLYVNEFYILAMNAKNRLETEGIHVELKNEFASGAAIGGQAIWPELWVKDADYERAQKILESTAADAELAEWICQKCQEKNPGNFNVCWNCQTSRPAGK